MYDGINKFAVAHAVACARLGKQIGSIAHTLHTASHEYLLITCTDGLRSEHDGFEARAADFVNSECGDIIWETGSDGGLARWCLTDTRRDDVAHDDFFNGVRRYSRTTDSFSYSDGTQLGCAETGKVAKKFASRRSGRSDDDSGVFCHVLRSPHLSADVRVGFRCGRAKAGPYACPHVYGMGSRCPADAIHRVPTDVRVAYRFGSLMACSYPT